MTLRPLTASERALLDKLVETSFPGSNEIKAQLQSIQVRKIDDEGSLELVSTSGPAAMVTERVPVEGELRDRDGVGVHVLLHVVEGRITELEVFKEDGSEVLDPLDHERMTVTVLT
jgi:hypothetical protein